MTSAACYHVCVRWVVFILLAAAVAEAGPVVEIRAQTQLSLTRVRKVDASHVQVTGRLHDKLTGEGIGPEVVSVTVAGHTEKVRTDTDGTFTIEMEAPDGEQEVTLGFTGASRLEKAPPLTVTTDPAKAQIELEIAKVADDPAGAKLIVHAKSDADLGQAPFVGLSVAIDVGGVDDKLVHEFDAPVEQEFLLERKKVGGAGVKRVRASFGGDESHQPATQTVTIELTSATTTTMALNTTKLAFEDDLVATGKVVDEDGSPVAHAAVTLVSGDRRLAQGATNDKGVYRFSVEGEIIGSGQFGVQVQAEPSKAFVRGSRSNPEIVRVAAPQPVPVSYTIAAFLATAIAAGGFFAARNKPWKKLRRTPPPAEVPSKEGEIEQQQGGLVVAKPGIVSTLRRPHDDGFAGVVRDTVRGRPVEDAVVIITLGDRERSVRTGADGSFTIDKLEHGEWRAEVAAPGQAPERFAVSIPTRG
jgi:hypothetical protein